MYSRQRRHVPRGRRSVRANRRVPVKASYTSGQYVTQVAVDIAHDGDYDLSEIEDILIAEGYDVLGIESYDVTDQY